MIDFFEYLNQKNKSSLISKMLRVCDESSLESLYQNISQHKKILRCVLDEDPDILQIKDSLVEYATVLCDQNKSYKDRKAASAVLQDFIWLEELNFGSFDRESGGYYEVVNPLRLDIKKPEYAFWGRLFPDRRLEGAYKAQQKLFKRIQEEAGFLEKICKAVYS